MGITYVVKRIKPEMGQLTFLKCHHNQLRAAGSNLREEEVGQEDLPIRVSNAVKSLQTLGSWSIRLGRNNNGIPHLHQNTDSRKEVGRIEAAQTVEEREINPDTIIIAKNKEESEIASRRSVRRRKPPNYYGDWEGDGKKKNS